MKRKMFIGLVVLAAASTDEVWADSSRPVLKNNPFNQPNLVVESVPEEGSQVPRWSGFLRATLVAGTKSLANVNGTLVGVGEDYNGYTLLKVGEGEAIFVRADERLTLLVGGNEDDLDDGDTVNDD